MERHSLTKRQESRIREVLEAWVLTGRQANMDSKRLFEDGLGGRPLEGIDFEDQTPDEVARLQKFQKLVDDGNYAESVLLGKRDIIPYDVECILGVESGQLEETEDEETDYISDNGYTSTQLLVFYLNSTTCF